MELRATAVVCLLLMSKQQLRVGGMEEQFGNVAA
jgi:hypothetical protein